MADDASTASDESEEEGESDLASHAFAGQGVFTPKSKTSDGRTRHPKKTNATHSTALHPKHAKSIHDKQDASGKPKQLRWTESPAARSKGGNLG